MDYNNILNNKRKFNELKNKTLNILEKATDKITEVTTTAVDTVVDKVKVKSQQQSKAYIFQDILSVVNSKLIEESIDNVDFKLSVYKNKTEDELSIESIVWGLVSTFEETLKENILSADYIDALYELVKVHYKYEAEINFELNENFFTIGIIRKEVKEETINEEKEHVCDCEPKCDVCNCNQEIMTLEFIQDK